MVDYHYLPCDKLATIGLITTTTIMKTTTMMVMKTKTKAKTVEGCVWQ